MKIIAIINASSGDKASQISNIGTFVKENEININDIDVLHIEGNQEDYDAGYVLDLLQESCQEYDFVMFSGNDSGSELAVRLGMRLEGSSITDVLQFNQETMTATKKVYAGNLLADYSINRTPCCISIDRSVDGDENNDSKFENSEISALALDKNPNKCDKILHEIPKLEGLSQAKLVLACGQGLNKKSAVDEAAEIATLMGAHLGASRPVVMNAWAPMSSLIGVSGNMIKPQVCITAAVSGSPAFFAGIEKSRTIIAINTDEHAQIMSKADMAVKGDAREILEALAAKFEEN